MTAMLRSPSPDNIPFKTEPEDPAPSRPRTRSGLKRINSSTGSSDLHDSITVSSPTTRSSRQRGFPPTPSQKRNVETRMSSAASASPSPRKPPTRQSEVAPATSKPSEATIQTPTPKPAPSSPQPPPTTSPGAKAPAPLAASKQPSVPPSSAPVPSTSPANLQSNKLESPEPEARPRFPKPKPSSSVPIMASTTAPPPAKQAPSASQTNQQVPTINGAPAARTLPANLASQGNPTPGPRSSNLDSPTVTNNQSPVAILRNGATANPESQFQASANDTSFAAPLTSNTPAPMKPVPLNSASTSASSTSTTLPTPLTLARPPATAQPSSTSTSIALQSSSNLPRPPLPAAGPAQHSPSAISPMRATPPTAKWTPIGRSVAAPTTAGPALAPAPAPAFGPAPTPTPSQMPPASTSRPTIPSPGGTPQKADPEGLSGKERQDRLRQLYMFERRRIADRIKNIMTYLIEKATGHKVECVTLAPAKGASYKIIGPQSVLAALEEPEQHYITGMSTELRRLVPHLLIHNILKVVPRADTTTTTEPYDAEKWKEALLRDDDDGWNAVLPLFGSNKPFANLGEADLRLLNRDADGNSRNTYTPRKRTFTGTGPPPGAGGSPDTGDEASASLTWTQEYQAPVKRPRGRPRGYRPPRKSDTGVTHDSFQAQQEPRPPTFTPQTFANSATPYTRPSSVHTPQSSSPEELSRILQAAHRTATATAVAASKGTPGAPMVAQALPHHPPVGRKSFPGPRIPPPPQFPRSPSTGTFPTSVPQPSHQQRQAPPPASQPLPVQHNPGRWHATREPYSSSQPTPPSQIPPPSSQRSNNGSIIEGRHGGLTYPPFVKKLEELQDELEMYKCFLEVAYDSDNGSAGTVGVDEDDVMEDDDEDTSNKDSMEIAKRKVKIVEKEIKKVKKLGRQYEIMKPKAEKFERARELCEAIERDILGVC